MRSIISFSAALLCSGAAFAQTAPVPGTPAAQVLTPPPAVTPTPVTPPATSAAPAADTAATDDLGPDPTAPNGNAHYPGDPLEKFNRKVWALDMTIDRIALKPASSVYRHVAPKPLRHGLSRVISNLSEPWSFVNNVLQGHPDRAARNLGRFLVNSTIGVGGLADHASKFGIRPASEDFGQTLAVWGVMRSSPYLVLPLLGPSTIRDGIGIAVASFADPYSICLRYCVDTSFWTRTAITAFTAVSARADATEAGADTFLKSSLDSYAAARSAYLQARAAAIANADDTGGDMAGPADTAAPAKAGSPAPTGGDSDLTAPSPADEATPPDGAAPDGTGPATGDGATGETAPGTTVAPEPQPAAPVPPSTPASPTPPDAARPPGTN